MRGRIVSVEPPPKQGCEISYRRKNEEPPCLSGTPAEAGVRAYLFYNILHVLYGLSGTPAEAGVRGIEYLNNNNQVVSQWNPRRSRGASGLCRVQRRLDKSQWNPRRSRGASVRTVVGGPFFLVSVEPPPKQGCERSH